MQSDVRSLFMHKFAWVFEFPYTIWRVVDAQYATYFLREHDRIAEAGTSMHRVGQFLVVHEAWTLRREMEHLVATGKLTDRLWAELQGYRMCPPR